MENVVRQVRRKVAGRGPARLLAALAGLALVAVPHTGSAQWLQTSTGPAAVNAMALQPVERPKAARSGLTVTVEWTPVTFRPGVSVGYVVRRYNGSGVESTMSGGTCRGDASGVVSTSPCTDTRNLLDGAAYTYRVEPVLRNWTGPPSLPTTPAV